MAPVLIDTTADFSPAATTSPAGPPRSLLLAPPSRAAHEDRLRAAFSAFDRATTDLQMLDRLSAGLVTLPPATYELVLVLTDGSSSNGGSQRGELSRAAYALLVPAMATGGRLRFQDGLPRAGDVKEAILAGLVESGDGFEKLLQEETVIPLRFGKKKKKDTLPAVRNGEDNAVKFDFSKFDDADDNDIIDENDLLSEADLKRRPLQPTECQPQKRRRPCKDCTCGLAAKFEAEDKKRRAEANAGLGALRLNANDLNELDFTVEGKTGSCNNCSLGDAFRCSTCPYIGLPAFKPGEEVRILNDLVQL
ncbi:Fe-S cluster assembly protein dre2 [Tolypocladium ophioglossoides CBS 100239]|uniref:Fe-S cluster assembly protein dre2 n=1 Tax=Tolypocladium ophioglossoides (strain CBS 100239) TaxID=1163406 RepID=A0A0L0N6C6_TOLOC|nr:Fe-S cluster assembly protein dre2 [Tolypocladium ophioglossoides CBS 100239]